MKWEAVRSMPEYLDVVDDSNIVIGKALKEEIYAKKLPHRIVHIFVLDAKNQKIYLQQRSQTVSFLPGYYCTSASGHVQSGETYEQAAKRELREELGVSLPLKKVSELYFVSNDHRRFIELFIAVAEGEFSFADGEVSGGEFMSIGEAKKLIDKGEKIHPQLDLCLRWVYDNQESVLKYI